MSRLFLAGMAFAAAAIAAPVTFNKDVLPVLQKNCQGCHRPGQIGPMPLLTYQNTRPWAKAIKEAVLTKKMPPWFADPRYGHFANERKLTDSEIAVLVRWAESGAPRARPRTARADRSFPPTDGTSQPDRVFAMPTPYEVPATGVIEYTYFVIPTGFTEDTWVAAAEVLPSNRKVVHHVIAFVRPPGSQWMKEAKPGEPFVPVVHKRDANGAGIGGGAARPPVPIRSAGTYSATSSWWPTCRASSRRTSCWAIPPS